MKRKKILCMTDSPKLHTGFARVGKEIFTYLNKTKKYEIICVGWFHQETQEEVIYPIWTTHKNERGVISQKDKYAHESFPRFVDKFKPDLVWTLGDMWMIDHVANAPNRKSFKWIGYFPIDGQPVPSKWGKTVENMDIAVAYGKFGKHVISKRAPNANLKYIYHGVASKIFLPYGEEEKRKAKEKIFGISGDTKIIGVVARNQPRKAFDKILEAYFYILNGMYVKCSDCNKITVCPYDIVDKKFTMISKCRHCLGTNVNIGSPRNDVKLYLHAASADCGWDLIDLQKDYDLSGKILINPQLKIGIGVNESLLIAIYNSFDIFTLPSRGEGFGLPIIEAMSCGVPVVVSDYSAHREWAGDGGILVPPIALEAEPLTNIRRAIIDMDLYVTGLLELLDNPELRLEYGKGGRARAEKMDWSSIVKQWEKMIDGILYPEGIIPKIEAHNVEYSLEEV